MHLANNSDIAIPQAMAGLVRGVNLQNFSFSKPALARAVALQRSRGTGLWEPIKPTSIYAERFIDPNDFAKIYDLNPVYSGGTEGSGETIGIVARTAPALSDIEAFREAVHLPAHDPNLILNGPQYLAPALGDALEVR
jgi:subtilase family serine protease